MGDFRVQGLQVGLVAKYDYLTAEAEIELELGLAVGDRIHIIGFYTDFVQRVESMTFRGDGVQRGRSAQALRVPVKYHVREGDALRWFGPNAFEDEGILRKELCLFDYGLLDGAELVLV